MVIYTVTTVCLRFDKDDAIYWENTDFRTVGWWPELKDAEKTVVNNLCDINEGQYQYCVIEGTSPGCYSIPVSLERWYKFKNGKYHRIKKPEVFHNICGFGIG